MLYSIKTVLRHLWKQRLLFTTLNILGLGIGIAACWIIAGIISYEFSYEKGLPEKERTFRLVSSFIFDEKESHNGGVSAPVYQAIRSEIPQVEIVAPVFQKSVSKLQRPSGNGKPVFETEEVKRIAATDSAYFDLVPYTWLAGDKRTSLNSPDQVVLTESRARKYFGDRNPADLIGELLVYNDTTNRRVSGILKDLDYPTEFSEQEFIYLKPEEYSLNTWTNTNGSDKVYMRLRTDADTAKLRVLINQIVDAKTKEFAATGKQTWKMQRWLTLMNIKDSHFSTHIKEWETRKASKPVLYGLIGLAGFLLLLACINYINLATAQIPQRRKEIGVRKTLGGGRKQLMSQIFNETLLTVFLSALLAWGLSKPGFKLLGELVPDRSQEFANQLPIFLGILALVILITAISGFYPAWLIAKVRPVSIMKGNTSAGKSSQGMSARKVLIVTQFVIAQVFISAALIMGAQLNYTLKKDLGFNKDAVVIAQVPWKFLWGKYKNEHQHTLLTELRRLPGIETVALGTEPMSANYNSGQFQYSEDKSPEPIKRQVFRKTVDTSYMKVYDLELIAGRGLNYSDATREYVINESLVTAFGLKTPQEAIGKLIGQPGYYHPIVGVIKDFHQQSFHTTIDPMVLQTEKGNLSNFNIRLKGNDPAQWRKTLSQVETNWNKFYPAGSFSYKFYDEVIESLYKEERNTSVLINMATIISIVISCLGLFGLATVTAFQRAKEISIRKVLGASVSGIVSMLSSDFVKLIGIALLIAIPIAWWGMDSWLADFAYRVPVSWWFFGIAGFIAMIFAVITVSYQSIRAARANPVDALKAD